MLRKRLTNAQRMKEQMELDKNRKKLQTEKKNEKRKTTRDGQKE